MDTSTALASLGLGTIAGLGVAVPLGPVGVLVVAEGVARGFRGSLPAVVAVALIDTLYGFVALAFGHFLAPLVTGVGTRAEVVAGCVLIAIALTAVRAARNAPSAPQSAPSSGSRSATFAGLTLINPATLLYFTAVVLPRTGSIGLWSGLAFVCGIAVASLTWQSLLAELGAMLHGRLTRRSRVMLTVVGNGIVAAMGATMIVHAIA